MTVDTSSVYRRTGSIIVTDGKKNHLREELNMGSLMDILGGPNGDGAPMQALLTMLLGLDNVGANLFGSLADTAGGIFGSLDTLSFAPPVVP
ncbi:hypothetical protein [Rhodococcus sp. NPDC060176]|uniref:hypothetical protein n=1 Tax=unclassified Rhodococcus (in: high G+C Gram-positive bacteria) TaxID=192944 RepID=UPI00364D9F96